MTPGRSARAREVDVDDPVTLPVATDRARAVLGPVRERCRALGVQVARREHDALPGVADFVPPVGLPDEPSAEFAEMVVEQASIGHLDSRAQLRERERVLGSRQFPEDREPVFVRHGGERVGRLRRGVVRRVAERVFDGHGRGEGVSVDVLCGTSRLRYRTVVRGTLTSGLAHRECMPAADIEFRFESPADEDRFLREYLVDAWERYLASDYWETGWFWAYRQFRSYEASPEGGLVVLVFEGDPDELVATESDRWESVAGLEDWELRRYEETDDGFESLLAQQRDVKGQVGGEREYLLKPLASQFSLAYLREFDESVPAVAELTDGNPAGVGFWALFHYVCIQTGYDWYEETDMYLRGLRNRVKSVARYRGADEAREEYDRIREAVLAMDDHLDEWLDEHPTGEGTIP